MNETQIMRRSLKQVGTSKWYFVENHLVSDKSWAKYTVTYLGSTRGADKKDIVTFTKFAQTCDSYSTYTGKRLPKFVAEAVWADLKKTFTCEMCKQVSHEVEDNLCDECFLGMPMEQWVSA
jgi:hypothetical protein